jgi:cell division protein FtsL
VSAQVVRPRPRSKKEKRRKLAWLTEAQAALGWAVLLALAAVLGAIYLHQTSGIARVGRTVQELQYELNEVKRENTRLELKIAEAQSLSRLNEESDKLGFRRALPEDIEYLVILDFPPEMDPTELEDPQPELVPFDSAIEALFRHLTSRIGSLGRGEAE